MAVRFAEVIGDPIAQSKSPIIHGYWLEQLAIEGEYRATRVEADGLSSFLEGRKADLAWAGCNVTIPHKANVIPLLDELDKTALAVGAVNTIVPTEAGIVGYNTDVDGIATALDAIALEARKVVVIGAGGAARAAVAYLASRKVDQLVLVARNPVKAEALGAIAARLDVSASSFDGCDDAFGDASAIINASPLGMAGSEPMPEAVLKALAASAHGVTLFDMVTTPRETPFLITGRSNSAHVIDGLTMLIGQARRAFELFFGQAAPAGEYKLRELILSTDIAAAPKAALAQEH